MMHLTHIRLPLSFFVIAESKAVARLHAQSYVQDEFDIALAPYLTLPVRTPDDIPAHLADRFPYGIPTDRTARALAATLPPGPEAPVTPPSRRLLELHEEWWSANRKDLADHDDRGGEAIPGHRLYRVRANMEFLLLSNPEEELTRAIGDTLFDVLDDPSTELRMERITTPAQLRPMEGYLVPHGAASLNAARHAGVEEEFYSTR